MSDIKHRAREYLRGQTQLNGGGLFHFNILNLVLGFAEQETKEIKKENTELKETLRTYNGCGDWDNDFHTCRVYLQHEELQECMEQLTKAKELFKMVLDWQCRCGNGHPTWQEVCAKIEQFLSEVEK